MLALIALSKFPKLQEIKPAKNHLHLTSNYRLLTVILTSLIRTLWLTLSWWSRRKRLYLANRLSQANSNLIETKPCWNRVRSKLWRLQKFTSSWQITKNWRKFAKKFAIQLCQKHIRPIGLRTFPVKLRSSRKTLLALVKHAIKSCDDHRFLSKNQGLVDFIQLFTLISLYYFKK